MTSGLDLDLDAIRKFDLLLVPPPCPFQAELARHRLLSVDAAQHLLALGLPLGFLINPPARQAEVCFLPGNRFEFVGPKATSSTTAILTFGFDDEGQLSDIIAFDLKNVGTLLGDIV